MSGLSQDPDVEKFLTNFTQLDKTRAEENDIRFKSLEKQLEEKKKRYELSPMKNKKLPPIVPSKNSNLSKIIPTKKVENDEIPLFNPIASKNRYSDQPNTLTIDLDYEYEDTLPKQRRNEPKPIKLDDVLQSQTRTDIKGFKGYLHTSTYSPSSPSPTPIIASKPKQFTTPVTNLNSNSKSNITKTYVPMPSKLNAISATAAAKAPQLMKNKVDSSAGDKFWEDKEDSSTSLPPTRTTSTPYKSASPTHAQPIRSGTFVPMPSKSNVLSATAAAKAPQLMRNKVDSSAGDRFWEGKTKDDHQKDYDVIKPFLPMPSKINAFSAAAAAKAKPLAQTKIETTLNDKTSDIDMTYKYLTRNSDAFKSQVKEKTKPELPSRKPDAIKIEKKLVFKEEDKKTDAFRQLNSLKPARPIAKQPEVENEAFLKLQQLKSKSSRGTPTYSSTNNTTTRSTTTSSSMASKQESITSIPRATTKTSASKFVAIALPGLANADELNSLLKSKSLSNTPMDSRNSSTTNLISRSKTIDNSDLSGDRSSQKLNHVTKSRAKGPKRRLPKSVGNSPLPSRATTIVEAPTNELIVNKSTNNSSSPVVTPVKKIPPPIKKPSRVVSNSAIFI